MDDSCLLNNNPRGGWFKWSIHWLKFWKSSVRNHPEAAFRPTAMDFRRKKRFITLATGLPPLHHLCGLLLREEESPGHGDHRLRFRRRNFSLRPSRNLAAQRIRLERDQHGKRVQQCCPSQLVNSQFVYWQLALSHFFYWQFSPFNKPVNRQKILIEVFK